MSHNSLPPRAEAALDHTWNMASVYATPADFETAVDELLAELPRIRALQESLGRSPAELASGLSAIEEYRIRMQRAVMYAQCEFSVDTTDQAAAARLGRARTLEGQVRGGIAFVDPALMAIGFDTLRAWIGEEPRLAQYSHYFDQLERRSAHVRSAEVEELLGMSADVFTTARATHGVLVNSELSFEPAITAGGEPVEFGQGTINVMLTHPDREVRRSAWEHYADSHLAVKNTLASCVATVVKEHVYTARARRYQSTIDAALSANFIPEVVFHNLIDTFKRHLPTWHRYWDVRRRAMGLDTLREFDVKAPLSAERTVVPYEQAVEWICEGMQPLGDEYVGIVRRGCLQDRWVDVYPNRGKSEGAYSSGQPGTQPFIFMSYNNDLFSMSTLAHELGHSLHSWYTWHNQPLTYSRYTIFAAEVASNFNQAMVRDHMLRTQTDRNFQIGVLEEAMSNFHRYFLIMPTLARFELAIHQRVEQNQPLSAGWMNDLLADLYSEAYGSAFEVDRERTGVTWAEFPTHMYLNYYVFQYATGISGAHALARGILDGKPGAVDRYLGFLKAGSSQFPLDALREAGVDLSTPEPVEQAFATMASYVDRLDALLNQ